MTERYITAYGAISGNDSTAAINAAFAQCVDGDTVVIPAGTWLVAPTAADGSLVVYVRPKSNTTLKFLPGAVLKALPTTSGVYAVISLVGVQNVTITGPGQIIGDRGPQHTSGEWGSGILINLATNVTVDGVSVSNCWGDGVDILAGNNIVLININSNYNRRNGMAVAAVSGLSVTNCDFHNIAGTAPSCGIDFETDLASQTIEKVTVAGCQFANTVGANISVGSPQGVYRNFSIQNCSFDFKTQPIWVGGNGGNLGTPWWAVVLKPIFGWKLYPTSWVKS